MMISFIKGKKLSKPTWPRSDRPTKITPRTQANPIEMLWHDLKQSFHARKPTNVAELKQFCKEERPEIPPQRCEDSLPVITNAWLQLLLQSVAQPVTRFRG